MKKKLIITIMLCLALSGCGKETGKGLNEFSEKEEPTIEASMPATYESEQDKENLNDTDKVVPTSSTTSIVSTLDSQSEPVYLSEEDASTVEDILEGAWNNGAVAECINNCSLSINDSQIYYHSECGTFNDSKNNRCAGCSF